MRKLVSIAVLAVLASFALVACGGGDDETTPTGAAGGGAATTTTGGGGDGGGGAASTLKLAADQSQIAYDTDSLSAKAGSITIDFDNPNDALPHDVCVESGGEDLGCSETVTGESSTLDLSNVKPGSYTFYCSVDAHRAAGMEGTLAVQ
jgi:plastocyanin